MKMRRNLYFAFMTILLCAIGGCTKETVIDSGQQILPLAKGTYATIPAVEFVGFDGTPDSDTKVSINPSTLAFGWQKDDQIGVVPMDGTTSETNYTVKTIQGDSTICSFDGGAWSLKEGLTYCAYRPYKNTTYKSTDNVAIVHSGQIQEENGSTSHLSRYAYMYADSVTNATGTVNFQFRHLSSILNFLIDAPATATYTELRIKAKDEIFAVGSFSLANGISSPSGEKSNEFTIYLHNIEVEEGDLLSIFATMLPWDYELTDNTLLVTLTDSEENEYTFSTAFGNVQAGKGYKLYCETSPLTTTFTSVLDLKSAIEKAGFDASKIYGLRIVTCTEGEGGYLVNGDLPDEEPLYVWPGLPNAPMLVTKAQKIKLPQYCTRLLNYESLSVAGMVDWTAENIDASQVISLEGMFNGCKAITAIDLGFLASNEGGITTTRDMFSGCAALQTIDMSALADKMGKVTDMQYMFNGCTALQAIDLSGWDTPSLTSCNHMFLDCSSLEDIDLSNLNTKKVSNLYYMMSGCAKAADITLGPNFTFPSYTTGMLSDLGYESRNTPEFRTTFHCSATQWANIQTIIGSSLIDYYRWGGAALISDGASLNALIPSTATKVTFSVNATPISGETAVLENIYKSVSGTEVTFRAESGKFLLGSTVMTGMFKDKASLQTIDGLRNIDWTGVTDISEMFSGCKALKTVNLALSNLTGSCLTNTSKMFLNCSSMEGLYLPEEFSTSNVTDMSYMFCGCNNVPNDRVMEFDTSSLVNASNMFGGAKSTNSYLDLRKWNVRKVEDMSYMFYNSSFQKIITDGWMTNSLEEVKYMFANSGIRANTTFDLNVSNVKNFAGMFKNCTELVTLELSNFNAWPEDISEMFSGCSSLQAINISRLNTVGATMYRAFYGCTNVRCLTLGEHFSLSDHSTSTEAFTDFGTTWLAKQKIKTEINCPVAVWETHMKVTLASFFSDSDDRFYCSRKAILPTAYSFNNAMNVLASLSNIKKIIFLYSSEPLSSEEQIEDDYTGAHIYMGWDESSGTITVRTEGEKFYLNKESGAPDYKNGMFEDCRCLEKIEGLELIETKEAESLRSMFDNCSCLTSLDLSTFNTSNVTNMQYMFQYCPSLTSLDISSFNTSNVTKMDYMFHDCWSLENLDVSNFNTSKVIRFIAMFENCKSLKSLDIKNFDFTLSLENVPDLQSNTNCMFSGCSGMSTLRLSPTFDPRAKTAEGTWHPIGSAWGKGTFGSLGIDNSSSETYTRIYVTSTTQMDVIKECMEANDQSVSNYTFVKYMQ